MKFFPALILFFCINGSCQPPQPTATNNKLSKPIVIELFTSEGCSSCPSAEKLLAELSDKDSNILLLSYHVDYWNRLGWTDSFSNPKFSERQYQYVSYLNLQSAYTPQAVVNGQNETVGSNRISLSKLIKADYGHKAIISDVSATYGNNKINIKIQTGRGDNSYSLLALLIQPQAATSVKSGENRGYLLQHKNIVRDMVTVKPNENAVSINMQSAIGGYKIVVLAQNPATLHIDDAFVTDVK